MIVDAPLKFPAHDAYYVLGESPISQKLQRILARLRPHADFKGFVADPAQAIDGRLVICEMAEPAARSLIDAHDDENIILFPLPLGERWNYWDFADIALELMPSSAPYLPSESALLDVLAEEGAVEFLDGDPNRPAFKLSHLHYHQDVIQPHLGLIEDIRDRLGDEFSKLLYDQILMGSPIDRMMQYAGQVFGTVQYFEVLNYGVCQTVLNGGVFEGFELPFLASKLPNGAVVYNIDPLGHDSLADYSRHWVEAASIDWRERRVALARGSGDVVMRPLESGQLSRGGAANADPSTLVTVPGISIDELVRAEGIDRVDLIKLDLEGGDGEALAGAVDTIVRHRPQIAASIYHYVNDFWQIPELLMSICDDYSFHLGVYSYERWETILYAIPNEIERETPLTRMWNYAAAKMLSQRALAIRQYDRPARVNEPMP